MKIEFAEAHGAIKDLFNKLAGENGSEVLDELKRFLRREDPFKNVVEVVETIVEKVTTILHKVMEAMLPATHGKETTDCFVGSRYCYLDGDLNRWLPKNQPAGKEGQITSWQLEKESTFKEVVASILGISDKSGTDVMAKALIDNSHTVTLPQIESLIERTSAGEAVGLVTKCYGNFFFVEDGKGGVVVVYVDRRGDWQWDVSVLRLDNVGRWDTEFRFFSRNLVTMSL